MDPELIAYLDARFGAIDRRFDGMNRRFDGMDRRFETIDRRFEAIDLRFESVQPDIRGVHILIEAMDQKIELVADGVSANTERIADLRSEMERQFDEVKAVNRLSYVELDRKLRDHDRRITDLEAR